MKQSALIRRFARATGLPPAVAADQLDKLVDDVITRIRRGQSARIPGLGAFPPGDRNTFEFEKPVNSAKRAL
jgi:nucleoid DNA-binding protein